MMVSYAILSWAGIILFYVPVLVIRDSHRRYVELKKAQDQLVHQERMAAKGEMAAEIGHEISNYLAAISARAQMLTLELGKADPEKTARHARIIMEQASNMAILTKGLMDFSHKEMKVVRVDLNDLLHRTVDFVKPQNKFDQVEFELDLAESLPAIAADAGQLQQVFINLFQNAAEAMIEKGTPQKKIVVSTGWQDPEETVIVRVTDNGPGMSRPDPREGLRADVHDQADGPRIRPRHVLPDRGRAPRADLGGERRGARRHVLDGAPGGRPGRLVTR